VLLLLLLRVRKNGLVTPTVQGGEVPAQRRGESVPFLLLMMLLMMLLLLMLLQVLRPPLLERLAVAIWRSPLAGFLRLQEMYKGTRDCEQGSHVNSIGKA
jgi:hypothetical protein